MQTQNNDHTVTVQIETKTPLPASLSPLGESARVRGNSASEVPPPPEPESPADNTFSRTLSSTLSDSAPVSSPSLSLRCDPSEPPNPQSEIANPKSIINPQTAPLYPLPAVNISSRNGKIARLPLDV